jgi:mannose-6-phosphate isomerase-like protein (cupin superfamily)
MPVVREEDAVTHEVGGSVFRSFVSGRSGSQVCTWRLNVPAGKGGSSHCPDHDEVFLVLDGLFRPTVNGSTIDMGPDEVLLVRAGDEFMAGAGPDGATCWVATTPGLTVTMADGSTTRPPWAQ